VNTVFFVNNNNTYVCYDCRFVKRVKSLPSNSVKPTCNICKKFMSRMIFSPPKKTDDKGWEKIIKFMKENKKL
jgi:hypothetical protein